MTLEFIFTDKNKMNPFREDSREPKKETQQPSLREPQKTPLKEPQKKPDPQIKSLETPENLVINNNLSLN
jgi:hypothetical protein